MRSLSSAPGLCLALAAFLVASSASSPALAAPLGDCARFAQADREGGGGLDLTIHSTCSMPLDCRLSWRLVCAPRSRSRRTSTRAVLRLTIAPSSSQTSVASAAACGDDDWTIADITWRCTSSTD